MMGCIPFVNIITFKNEIKGSEEIQSKAIIWIDASGDVTDFSGIPSSHNPVDMTIIYENASMNMLNVTFVEIPASGTTPDWIYIYMAEIDKFHDNTTPAEYSINLMKMVGSPPASYIQRLSDNYYWNGATWISAPHYDNNFAYIVGNNVVFNFGGCPALIGDNWYEIYAYFTDGLGSGYIDLALGNISTGSGYFAGGSTGQDLLPPLVQNPFITPSVGLSGSNFTIKANVTDPSNVSSVIATIQYPDEIDLQNVILFDDGLHNDGTANDTLYANTWNSTGQLNGIYYIDIWTNDTLGNLREVENAKFFIIGTVPETCLFDGLFYNWSGIYNIGIHTPWNGTENYEFLEGNIFYNNHTDSLFGPGNWYTDNATRILNTDQIFWGTNIHDHLFIPKNISQNDTILINIAGTNNNFTVSGKKYLDILNTTLECWELTETLYTSVLYYETSSGLLIQGTFNIGPEFNYSIEVDATNAQFLIKIGFSIIEPKNKTYYYSSIPVIIDNSTAIESAWYRNSTDGISWSNNYTLTYNGTHFTNTTCNWGEGANIIQIFANNTLGYEMLREQGFTIDTSWIELNSPNNFTYSYQTFPIIISNLTSVDYITFRYNMGSGWTPNGTLNWNGTYFINDTITWSDGYYHLQVFANDSIGSENVIDERFTVDTISPNGSQTASTFFTTIQTRESAGRIWVNGSAWDLGSGLKNVFIQSTNITGEAIWSLNIGTPSNWAFYNITSLPELTSGEKYLIEVNLTDLANNSFIIECYISFDFSGPLLTQIQATVNPQSGGSIWINGTAFDNMVAVQNVSIISSNLTIPASWSSNYGMNESWSFTNTSAVIDGYWELIVQAFDTLENSHSIPFVIVIDNTPPTNTALSFVLNGSDVTLTWLPVSDLTNVTYLIYQDGINIVNTTTLNCLITSLPKGTYEFYIIAMDKLGHSSESSNIITVHIIDEQPSLLFWILLFIVIGAAIGVTTIFFFHRRNILKRQKSNK